MVSTSFKSVSYSAVACSLTYGLKATSVAIYWPLTCFTSVLPLFPRPLCVCVEFACLLKHLLISCQRFSFRFLRCCIRPWYYTLELKRVLQIFLCQLWEICGILQRYCQFQCNSTYFTMFAGI